MEVLGGHLRSATESITSATRTGDWSAALFERITVDSHDQIGEAGSAFNSLLGAVEGRKELEERLRYQAFHDMLTGLPNRAYFIDKLAEAEAAPPRGHAVRRPLPRRRQPQGGQRQPGSRRRRHPHQAAQRAMVRLRPRHRHRGPALRRRVRHPARSARAASTRPSASPHRLSTRSAHPTRIGDHLVRTGFSIGLATSATCAASGIGMLRAADIAMYAAKSGGKGRLEVFQPSHHTAHVERDAVRGELSGALDAEQLELHYQPIVDVSTRPGRRLRGAAALAAPGARPDLAAGVHPARRGDRPDRADRPLGAAGGHPAGRRVAEPLPARPAAHERQRLRAPVPAPRPGRGRRRGAAAVRPGRTLLTLEITESLFAQDTEETARKIGCSRISASGWRSTTSAPATRR